MAIQLKSTADSQYQFIKTLVYGLTDAGKTYLIRTMPSPLIISAEGGLLSLADVTMPYIEVKSMADVNDAYRFITESQEAKQFGSIALDSISEIAEVVLTNEKKSSRDGRAAYGEMNDKMSEMIRAFRDLPEKHVYFSAKCEKMQDESGKILYGPSMPGKTLSQGIAYYFDLVLALRKEKDAEGNVVRALMAESDGVWMAKNRGGKLQAWEAPNLGAIIEKVKA